MIVVYSSSSLVLIRGYTQRRFPNKPRKEIKPNIKKNQVIEYAL